MEQVAGTVICCSPGETGGSFGDGGGGGNGGGCGEGMIGAGASCQYPKMSKSPNTMSDTATPAPISVQTFWVRSPNNTTPSSYVFEGPYFLIATGAVDVLLGSVSQFVDGIDEISCLRTSVPLSLVLYKVAPSRPAVVTVESNGIERLL